MTNEDLKQWRESLGLSQRAAAAKHGVEPVTYQTWERGTSFKTGKPVKIKPSVVAMCEKISRESGSKPNQREN